MATRFRVQFIGTLRRVAQVGALCAAQSPTPRAIGRAWITTEIDSAIPRCEYLLRYRSPRVCPRICVVLAVACSSLFLRFIVVIVGVAVMGAAVVSVIGVGLPQCTSIRCLNRRALHWPCSQPSRHQQHCACDRARVSWASLARTWGAAC